MPLREIQTLALLYIAVSLRLPVLEISHDMVRVNGYYLDVSSDLGNSSESADSR